MEAKININNLSKEIPPLPVTVAKIIDSLGDENVSVEIISSIIMEDPALSLRILGLANSPFYGLTGHVSSIKEACMVLGIYTLRNIAMAAGIVAHFPSKSGASLDTGKLWRHAVGTGVAAKILARYTGNDEDIAFTGGLLHDIGKIILDRCVIEEYKDVIEHRKDNDCFLIESESHILGLTHEDAGKVVAEKWNLPDIIIDVIRFHHSPDETNTSTMTHIVHIADIICRGLAIGNAGDTLIPNLNPSSLTKINISFDDISLLLGEIDTMSGVTASLLLN